MAESKNHCNGRTKADGKGGVAAFLTTALNMEDQISRSVYEEYMSRANWPAELDGETFEQIKSRLTTLIEETKGHAKILQTLVKEHAQSK
ncbi:MAG: hypothetical protein ABFE01_15150 [Phycisphaerales bacterium]